MEKPIETSLGHLSDHEWQIVRSRWMRGIDWNVFKRGRGWTLPAEFGNFPIFKTKTAAYEAASNLICLETQSRAYKAQLEEAR